MVVFGELAQAGVLMSSGVRIIDAVRRLSYYIDRILKGAKPGELPVEQPTRFYLIDVNLKTAKAIGLTTPQSLSRDVHRSGTAVVRRDATQGSSGGPAQRQLPFVDWR